MQAASILAVLRFSIFGRVIYYLSGSESSLFNYCIITDNRYDSNSAGEAHYS